MPPKALFRAVVRLLILVWLALLFAVVPGALAQPTATDDNYSTSVGQTLTQAAPGVLANDSGTGALTAVYETGSGPANGTLNLNADGSFTYTPNVGFNGVDSFQYRATSGPDSSLATVTITVNPVNANDDAYNVLSGQVTAFPAPGVLANDTPAGLLTAAIETNPGNGTVVLRTDGSFDYTPNAGFTGSDTFTYRAVLTGGAPQDFDIATVTITVAGSVNVVANTDTYTAVTAQALTVAAAAGVLANDTPAGQLSAAILSLPSNGTVTLSANGSFVYTSNAGFTGTDTFVYRATLTGSNPPQSDSASVFITVQSTAPTATPVALIATNDTYSNIPANTIYTNSAPGVLLNDFIPSGLTAAAQLVTAPGTGSVVLNPDGSFTYTPPVGFLGAVTFQYRILQGTNTSNTATVTLNYIAIATPAVNVTAVAPPTALPTLIPLFIPGPTPVPQPVPNGGQLASAVCAPVPTDVRVVVNRDGVNVRLFPAIGAEVIGFVNAGYAAQVRARSADSQWIKVDFSGEEGWIGFPVITLLSGNLDSIPVEDPRTIPYGGFGCPRAGLTSRASDISGILRDSGVRVRSGPSRAYVVLANAPRRTVLPILGRTFNNAWFQVNFNGVLGWVIAREVELQDANFTDAPVDGIIADALPISEPTSDSYFGTLRLLLDRLNIAQQSLDAVRQRWTDAALNGQLACGDYPASPTDYAVANPIAAAFYDTLVPLVTDFNSAMANLRVPIDLLLQACTSGNRVVGQPQIQIALQAISNADGLFAALRQRLSQLIPPDGPIGPDDCPFTFANQTDILPRVRQGQLAVLQLNARNFVLGFCIDAGAGQQLRVEALAFQGNAQPVVSISPYDNPTNFIGVGRASGDNTLVTVGPITIDRTAVYLVVISDVDGAGSAPLDSRVAVLVTDIAGAAGGFLAPGLSIDPATGQLVANPNPSLNLPQALPAPGTPAASGTLTFLNPEN